VAEPATTDRRVAEVIEIQYPSHDKAIQGLLRGEVSYLPRIPPATVKSLGARSEFYTQQYGLPTSHFLQFHPKQKALQSRALRRALIYALDRKRVLEELILHEPEGALGRLTSAPWPTKSYAYNRFMTPHSYDPALAYSLAKNAERELKSKVPELRLWVPDDPELAAAAEEIAGAWRKIGVATRLVRQSTGGASPSVDTDDWDVVYRAEVVAEPLVELWTMLALTSSTETSALGYLPTWLRHDLLELDRVGDWRSAEQLLHKLHRQFWAEVHLIPLWEVEETYVVRKNLRNLPEHALHPYQGIERWKVDPWYSRD
jgi:ABC-type transport system substrate-binding protein